MVSQTTVRVNNLTTLLASQRDAVFGFAVPNRDTLLQIMSETDFESPPARDRSQGYFCPFCEVDCSPIAGVKCPHLFLVDGENGWRFVADSQRLFDSASSAVPTLFRDLLYHDPECRALLSLRRASYDDSLEIYVYSRDIAATVAAFESAISAVR